MDVDITLELGISTTFSFEFCTSSARTVGAGAVELDGSSLLENLFDRWPCWCPSVEDRLTGVGVGGAEGEKLYEACGILVEDSYSA
jgi:hypothetical protein